jgi:hypothetical protein
MFTRIYLLFIENLDLVAPSGVQDPKEMGERHLPDAELEFVQ